MPARTGFESGEREEFIPVSREAPRRSGSLRESRPGR
jgi:hypothetical protein